MAKKVNNVEPVELDPELINILNSGTEATEEEPVPEPETPKSAASEVVAPAPQAVPPPVQSGEPPIPITPTVVEPVLIPVSEITPQPAPSLADGKKDEHSEKVAALIGLFSQTVNTVLNNYATDRLQVDEALAYFENEVKTARATGTKLPPSLIDGWVKLLSVKSDINTNSIGVLDSMAKLLAAARNNNMIINVGATVDGKLDLKALLDQPRKFDET